MINIITNEKFYLPIIYALVGVFIYYIIGSIIEKLGKSSRIDKRQRTIISLIKNIIKYIIIIFVIIGTLNIYGVNTNSILASLGVASVVIGLAFKDIVTDFLSGMFIIFDNQYTIGDVIEINGFRGEVISLGLRTTKIKAFTGEVKIISNSAFKEVTNFNLKTSTVYLSVGVSYNTKLDKLEKVLKELEPLILDIPEVNGKYNLLGVDEFASSAIIYTVSVDTKPMASLTVKRKINRLIKDAFDKNNIGIPFNQVDVNIRK